MKNANKSKKNTCKHEITNVSKKIVYGKMIETSDSSLNPRIRGAICSSPIQPSRRKSRPGSLGGLFAPVSGAGRLRNPRRIARGGAPIRGRVSQAAVNVFTVSKLTPALPRPERGPLGRACPERKRGERTDRAASALQVHASRILRDTQDCGTRRGDGERERAGGRQGRAAQEAGGRQDRRRRGVSLVSVSACECEIDLLNEW